MRACKAWCTAILITVAPTGLRAQVITGVVRDQTTGATIEGVELRIEGITRSALSRASGRYTLEEIPPGLHTLIATRLGYATTQSQVTVSAGQVTVHDVVMAPEALELDAIVVTGTVGAEQARAIGNTVGRVDGGRMAQVSALAHTESLLTGTVAGVNVQAAGGEVGTGANIRIRGAGSIALSSQPLLYVDGVRVNGDNADLGGGGGPFAGFLTAGVDGRTPPSRLNDINPEDIESIEIIKGPAAATLYGTEASNGVINIITKRGVRGDTRFSLTVKQGANWLPEPEEYFPPTYFTCQGTSGTCTPGEVVEFNVLREDRIRNGNTWFQTGHSQGYAGSVSGGSDEVRYYFSGDWDRDEGIVDYNWQNQFRARANLNWTPREDLDIDFGLGALRSVLESASATQPITTAIIWSCFNLCEAGSGWPYAVDGPLRGYGDDLPEVLAESVDGFQKVTRTTYRFGGTHRPTPWLTHRLNVGADWTETRNSALYRRIESGRFLFPDGLKTSQQQTTLFANVDYSATGALTLRDGLASSTTVGLQYYEQGRDWIYAEGRDLAAAELELVSAGGLKTADEGFVESKTLGAFVQQQLAWRDRVYVTVAARGDDNSAFGKDYDFVLYPKVSASWVVSEEPFMEPIDWLGDLRARAAWGKAGQQPDAFAALRTYEPAVASGGTPALRPGNVGNPNLEPEVGEEVEVGFDASLLDERIGLQLTYYDQVRKKAIIPVPARPSAGFPGTQFLNLGEIENSGVEIDLFASLVRSADWSLDMTLQLSTNSNEVASMGGVEPQVLAGLGQRVGQYYVEGFPLGSIFLRRVVSADLEGSGRTARATNVLCEGGAVIPGTPNLSRGSGAPVPCDGAPAIFAGIPVPSRQLSLSWALTLFEDFELVAQADYLGGHHTVIGDASAAHTAFDLSRESQEGDDPILFGYRSLSGGAAGGRARTGLIDASFAKMRRVAGTWTVPDRLATSIGAERLSVTLAAYNVATVWQATKDIFGYPIRDPESRATRGFGSDPGGLYAYRQEGWPMTKQLTLSARVVF